MEEVIYMKDIETVVSENIQKLMDEYNLNNVELAKIAGVSDSSVGKWLLKKATPRMGAIQKISDYFNIPKSYILNEDKKKVLEMPTREYRYLPTTISAGLPINVDGITKAEKIRIPDSLMGKWAGHKDILIMRINGDSMNKTMPDGSLIAVKPIPLENLKNDDIVVYSKNYDYSVKRLIKQDDRLVFRPHSTDKCFVDDIVKIDNNDLIVHGKVVLYIVEMG